MHLTSSTFRSTRPSANYRDASRKKFLSSLRTVHITADGLDLAREGLLGPSSTWTYMINDNPTGDILQRLLRGFKRLMTDEL